MKLKYAGHMANDLYWFIFPLILPTLISRFDLSFGQGGVLLTFYLLITAIGSFVIGKLSDKFPRREIMGFGFIAAALGLASTGFAPNFAIFLPLVGITGLAMSSFHPTMYSLLSEGEEHSRARTMSLYETSGTLGVLIMFLVNGLLIEQIGYRGVLIVTAVPGLIMGVIFLRANSLKETRDFSVDNKMTDSAKGKERWILVVFLISVILRVFSVTAILNFLPTILVNFAGLSVGMASFSTAFFFAGGIIGSLLAGYLTRKLNSFTILLGGTVLMVFCLPFFGLNLPGEFLIMAAFILGLLGSGCLINQNLIMSRLGGRFGRGEIFGILMGTMTVTTSISPALYGASFDRIGIGPTQWIFTIPMVLSGVILLILGPRREGQAPRR
ncbi:MAG: MFS transporter [Spirochaetales bacterium]|nr:MFS transporter [Spirochaetales bacterium]